MCKKAGYMTNSLEYFEDLHCYRAAGTTGYTSSVFITM